MEALIAAQELRMKPDNRRLGKVSPLTCPECHGALTEISDQGFLRFRCHTGHAYSAESLRSSQADAWERALYGALRHTLAPGNENFLQVKRGEVMELVLRPH